MAGLEVFAAAEMIVGGVIFSSVSIPLGVAKLARWVTFATFRGACGAGGTNRATAGGAANCTSLSGRAGWSNGALWAQRNGENAARQMIASRQANWGFMGGIKGRSIFRQSTRKSEGWLTGLEMAVAGAVGKEIRI